MTSSGQPLGSADAAWLHMERAENLMVINGVFDLEGRVPLAEVRQLVRERLLRHDRFRQRVVEVDTSHPRWVDDPDFDLDQQVVAGPAVADDEDLRRGVEAEVGTPLSFDHPPWRIIVFEGPDHTAILARVHHCIADGIALIRVLLTMADEHADEQPRPPRRSPLERASAMAKKIWPVVRRPLKPIRDGLGLLRTGAELVVRPADPPTVLQGPLSRDKRVAWSRTFDLAIIKRIAKAEDAKVNDVLTAAVAGALRRFMAEHGGEPCEIRAMVPVNLRPPERAAQLGNAFGLVMLPLPLSQPDGVRRIVETRHRMDVAKGTQEAVAAFLLLRGLGLLSRRLEAPFIRFFGAKASAVMTNVPGPRARLHMYGHALRWVMFWVPQSGSLALGISVLSYAGGVVLGVMADAGVVERPQAITDAFEEELLELQRRVLDA